MPVQAIIFQKKHWTTNEARRWLREHKYDPIKRVDVTANYLRYRIREPVWEKYITRSVGRGIKMVIGGL